jgi:hypothetical protein
MKLSRISKLIHTKWAVSGLFIVAILLAACSAVLRPVATQTKISPDPSAPIPVSQETGIGTGEITGVIDQVSNRWPDIKVFVFAAHFEGDNIDQGYYYLESSNSPSGEVDSQGRFVLTNIQVGHYILVVGPSAEESIRLVNLDQQYFLVEVSDGNKIDLGELIISN